MEKIFITSTLHSSWNLTFNPKLCMALEAKGLKCHLPQRDTDQDADKETKFKQNIDGIKNAQKILAVCKNYTPNFGLEVGFAYGLGKDIIFLTDDEINIPLMIKGVTNKILEVNDIEAIDSYIDDLIKIINS